MDLTLRRSRSDGSPADQACNVLRRDHVEEFGAARYAHPRKIQQKTPRRSEPIIDLERLIQMRIVEKTFPSNCRSRLFEVHTHHDLQVFGKLRYRVFQQP